MIKNLMFIAVAITFVTLIYGQELQGIKIGESLHDIYTRYPDIHADTKKTAWLQPGDSLLMLSGEGLFNGGECIVKLSDYSYLVGPYIDVNIQLYALNIDIERAIRFQNMKNYTDLCNYSDSCWCSGDSRRLTELVDSQNMRALWALHLIEQKHITKEKVLKYVTIHNWLLNKRLWQYNKMIKSHLKKDSIICKNIENSIDSVKKLYQDLDTIACQVYWPDTMIYHICIFKHYVNRTDNINKIHKLILGDNLFNYMSNLNQDSLFLIIQKTYTKGIDSIKQVFDSLTNFQKCHLDSIQRLRYSGSYWLVSWIRWIPESPIALRLFVKKYGPNYKADVDDDMSSYYEWSNPKLGTLLIYYNEENLVERIELSGYSKNK